jgi:LuxR family maltose regulon positive regulatory protein
LGHTHRAEALAGEALGVARGVDALAHPSTADAYLALTFAALEQAQPNKAALYLHEATLRARANQRLQLLWVCLVGRGLLQATAGRHDEATETILSATLELDSQPPPVVAERLFALRSRMARLGGSPELAFRIAAEWDDRSHGLNFELALDALALGDLDLAQKTHAGLPGPAESSGPLALIEHHLVSALLAEADGDNEEARSHLCEAMALGERHSLIEVFVSTGPMIVRLLSGLVGEHQDFRGVILKRSRESLVSSSARALTDPLTGRELEILSYLPSRLTNVELAHQCYVSVNTIKTHMAHIFQKLGATNRNDAIGQARAIGLL